jgi:hypothetical protein
MASLRTFFRPVKDRTLLPPAPKPKPRPVPTAPVTPEAYVSPLQTEVRAIIVERQRACNHQCTGCKYSIGQGCALDLRLAKAAEDREDPAPYLRELHTSIQALDATVSKTRKAYEDAKTWQQPMNRLRLGIYTAVGTGLVSAAIQVAKLMLGIP